MAPLRIGVNALYLIPGGVGGTEIYLRNLLEALAGIDPVNQYFVFINRETGQDLLPNGANFHAAPQTLTASVRPFRILWEQFVLPFEARRLELDALLNPGFTAPLAAPCPQVTVFHDLQHKRHPENFRWFDLPFWRLLLYGAAHRSTLLLADSEATRDDLMRYYGLPRAKVDVVTLGVEPGFFDIVRRPAAAPPYLLAVSTLHPHKNLDGLLRAFAAFRKTRPEFQLIVAGMRGFHTAQLERMRTGLALDDSVRFTGWIPRADLYRLYAGAAAFVYPSSFEGFGLPVLEALAAGLPTACSNIQPLAGIAGDAALLFDPSSVEQIAAAMLRLVSGEFSGGRGPARAALYSWKTTAAKTLDALTRAAKG